MGLNKSLYLFLNFRNPLTRAVVFATFIWEKFYELEFAAKILGGPPCYPIGSLVELLTPIGPMLQL
jgi:hypothetical protein